MAVREIERLQRLVEGRQGSLSSALASKQSIEVQISSLLPAEKASAQATLGEAQVELDKTVVLRELTEQWNSSRFARVML